jgi:hypothetical protein
LVYGRSKAVEVVRTHNRLGEGGLTSRVVGLSLSADQSNGAICLTREDEIREEFAFVVHASPAGRAAGSSLPFLPELSIPKVIQI